MRQSYFALIAILLAPQAHAQDQTTTPMLPIAASFGELISEGYDLITIDFRGTAWLEDGTNKLIACDLSGDPETEILSVCRQVGK